MRSTLNVQFNDKDNSFIVKMASSIKTENKGFLQHVKDFPAINNGKINASKFIEASLGLLWIVESLGKLFAPVKYDMEGNIDKIKRLDVTEGSCLLELMLNECSQTSKGKPVATEGLLWLNRSLHFFEILFGEIMQQLLNNNMDVNMKKLYTTAYEGSVKQYHNWVTKQIFTLICRVAPTLDQLLKSFGVDSDMESFKSKLASFNVTLHLVRCKIDDFYRDNKFIL